MQMNHINNTKDNVYVYGEHVIIVQPLQVPPVSLMNAEQHMSSCQPSDHANWLRPQVIP